MGYIWKFDNVQTQNEHKDSLGSCLCKMHLSFSKHWLGPSIGYLSWWVSIVMQNKCTSMACNQNFHIMLEIAGWTFLFWLHGKKCFYKTWLFNAPKTWAIDKGSNNGPFTTQGNSKLQWKYFILDGFAFSKKILNFGNVLLGKEFWLLATNFIYTHLHDRAINVCMHALVGLETLRA